LQFNQFYLLRFFCLFIFLLSVSLPGSAQSAIDTTISPATDSLSIIDSILYKKDSAIVQLTNDSVSKKPIGTDTLWQAVNNMPLQKQILERHPYFNFNAKAVSLRSDRKEFKGKEMLFYVITALVIIFAL
jgi:hypothetical protein